MSKLLKILTRLDWFMGGATLLVGLYLMNYWVIASGILGLLAAWYQPAARIKKYLEKKFLRKKEGSTDTQKAVAEDAFYAQVLGTQSAPQPATSTPAPVARPLDYSGVLPAGQLRLNQSRHSVVQYRHLNLVAGAELRKWA